MEYTAHSFTPAHKGFGFLRGNFICPCFAPLLIVCYDLRYSATLLAGSTTAPHSVPASIPTSVATSPEVAVPDHPSGYSPRPVTPGTIGSDEEVIEEEEDKRALLQLRAQVGSTCACMGGGVAAG